MHFHQLYCFTKVAELKSFSKAADEIFLSQSTVSTHINSLEKYFGQKLFDRLGREVILTPFGKKLYYWAVELLKYKDLAILDLSDWTNKLEGRISIIASTVPATYLAPNLIARFSKKYPGIDFSLSQATSEKVAELIHSGAADLGMLGETFPSKSIGYIPFAQEKLVLIAPSGVNFQNQVNITDLLDQPFIFRKVGSGTQSIIEKLLCKKGFNPDKLNIVARFDSVQSIIYGVQAGLGMAIVSEIAALEHKLNYYRVVELDQSRTFYFAYNKQKTMSPLITEFIRYST